ncbi:hypothetical protein OL231_00500 [Capnocytophaga ochracea]|uniref:Uncharacterized protein n=1 Tax=Capnocytophaga ochracea TaxID=1018 RepID=A0AA46W9F5_CAPOC|nr:hypothetical protein [Capnocytophaga ochracea]UZD41045.1 hypothetical protein OL231_00500 [Capnocytophaga ochracea]
MKSLKNKKAKQKICIFVIAKKIKTTPMLCKDKITLFFCIIDDILKEINHSEDIRRKVSEKLHLMVEWAFCRKNTIQ